MLIREKQSLLYESCKAVFMIAIYRTKRIYRGALLQVQGLERLPQLPPQKAACFFFPDKALVTAFKCIVRQKTSRAKTG